MSNLMNDVDVKDDLFTKGKMKRERRESQKSHSITKNYEGDTITKNGMILKCTYY